MGWFIIKRFNENEVDLILTVKPLKRGRAEKFQMGSKFLSFYPAVQA